MLIVIDKATKRLVNNMGTNSLYPDGNIPGFKVKCNEYVIRLHDESELAKKIMSNCHCEAILG